MPPQAAESSPHTVEKSVAVWLPVSPVLAWQESEDIMQVQSSALAMGGRAEAAAQAVPVAGHACATVLETT